MHQPGGGEEREGGQIARRIHHLGVGGCPGEVEPAEQDERDGPERPGSRAEKAVVKPKAEAKQSIKERDSNAGRSVFQTNLWLHDQVNDEGREQNRDCLFQDLGGYVLHSIGAKQSSGQGQQDAKAAGAQPDQTAADEVPGRGDAAEGRLEFVRAEGELRRDAEIEQHRQRNDASSSCDGINETGAETCGEQERIGPRGKRGGQRQVPGGWSRAFAGWGQ